MKTKLSDRTLYFDGTSEVNSNHIIDLLLAGKSIDGLFVDKITPEINQYNKIAKPDKQIKIKQSSLFQPDFSWNIPEEYKTLNVEHYILERLNEECDRRNFVLTDTQVDPNMLKRTKRVSIEMQLYKKMGLFDVLRAMIYVINTLHAQNIVWGVGRGSCVSSYILYLIGVHDVDSVHYDLDISDFLRTDDEER